MDLNASFEAWFDNASFTRNGDLKLVLVVPRRDKAKAIGITDLTGVRFNIHATGLARPEPTAVQRPTISQIKNGSQPKAIDV